MCRSLDDGRCAYPTEEESSNLREAALRRVPASCFTFFAREKSRRQPPESPSSLEFSMVFIASSQTVCLCADAEKNGGPKNRFAVTKTTAGAPARPFPSTRPPDSKQVRASPELCNASTDHARPAAARSRGRAARTSRLAGRFLLYAFPIAERHRATKRRTLISRSRPLAATRASPRRAAARETSAKTTRGGRALPRRGRRRDARG